MVSKDYVITKTFNIVLFLYLFCCSSIHYLFSPDDNPVNNKVPWDKFSDLYPLLALFSTFLIILILALCGSILLQIFWNRFVSDVFNIRTINYNESLSIVLIISLISI